MIDAKACRVMEGIKESKLNISKGGGGEERKQRRLILCFSLSLVLIGSESRPNLFLKVFVVQCYVHGIMERIFVYQMVTLVGLTSEKCEMSNQGAIMADARNMGEEEATHVTGTWCTGLGYPSVNTRHSSHNFWVGVVPCEV